VTLTSDAMATGSVDATVAGDGNEIASCGIETIRVSVRLSRRTRGRQIGSVVSRAAAGEGVGEPFATRRVGADEHAVAVARKTAIATDAVHQHPCLVLSLAVTSLY
jgi:hypothetical protein